MSRIVRIRGKNHLYIIIIKDKIFENIITECFKSEKNTNKNFSYDLRINKYKFTSLNAKIINFIKKYENFYKNQDV